MRLRSILSYKILQDAKRLKTWSVPQEKMIPDINPEVFAQAAFLKLVRLQAAFQRLKDQADANNSILDISLKQCELQVATSQGRFSVHADMSACTLFYNSPFSGTYKYYWEQDEERFISNKDKHLFDENIAREVVDKLRVVLQI